MMKFSAIFLLFSFFLQGCSQKYPPISTTITQQAHLYDQKKQVETVQYAIEIVKGQEYRYDSEVDPDGDKWDATIFMALEKRFEQLKNGVFVPHVQGDCEDTAFAYLQLLQKYGFPADQLYLGYALVPPSELSGVSAEYGGHAIVIAFIEGMKPVVLEQIPFWRTLEHILLVEKYYIVAVVRFDEDIREGWNYIDSYAEYERFWREKSAGTPSKAYLEFIEMSKKTYRRAK